MMKLAVKAIFNDRKKADKTWQEDMTDTGYVDDVIQKLILLAKQEIHHEAVISSMYDGIALYVWANSTVAEVKGHYEKARRGSMAKA